MNAYSLNRFLAVLMIVALGVLGNSPAIAQVGSIDTWGPTIGQGDGFGSPLLITGGDLLTGVPPYTPPQTGGIVISVGNLGLVPNPHGTYELDAASFGQDVVPTANSNESLPVIFSVDEFAIGLPGVPAPSVTTEGARLGSNQEASSDVYLTLIPPPIFLPPLTVGGNQAIADGNGLPPWGGQGLNLIEPNPPTLMTPNDAGDNIDGGDWNDGASYPVYYSLDTIFADPLEAPAGAGIPNTGTAAANGFVGGDVLVTRALGGKPAVFAPAASLGLDKFGPDTDDLDALVLWENGNGVYDSVVGPFSWDNGQTDMLLYSVRRGSAVIGTPDAAWGAPIEEGDILVPILGAAGYSPAIFFPAELLGLATVRSGAAGSYQIPNPAYGGQSIWADDLDALDTGPPRFVPEPGTATLFALGLLGIVFMAWRMRRRSPSGKS